MRVYLKDYFNFEDSDVPNMILRTTYSCTKRILIFILFFFYLGIYQVKAQYYLPGQDPSSTKWNQIKTEHFKIVFPENFEKKARMLADYLEKSYPLVTNNLKVKPSRITLVLHNQTVNSNAFVGWAPKRMEFYTCPPQDQYAHDWLKQLSLHEYTHVIQFSKMNQGVTKALSFLLGEQALAAVLGTFVPFWFIEGDAVLTETLHSNSGRGRLASFEMPIRTQVLEKGSYSYNKASFGSYRDFVPDHYILGYQLVSQGRKKYGDEIWNDALDNVSRKPYHFTPFSGSLKKTTGLRKNKLYFHLLDDLKIQWENQKNQEIYSDYIIVSPQGNDDYTDYTLPSSIYNSSLIAKKNSIDDITRIVLIDSSRNERRIFTPGRMMENSLSASRNLVTWAEMDYDLRWDHRTYSVIKTYDFVQKKLKKLTSKSRLFVPVLSNDAEKIAAVEVLENNMSSIIILDSRNGNKLDRIDGGDSLIFITPSWSYDDRQIVSIVLNDKGKNIALIDANKKKIQYLLSFSYKEISRPVFFRNFIIYTADYTGIENLYAYDTLTKQVSRITSSTYGARDACVSINEQKLYYCNYTANGYEIAMIDLIPRYWDPVEGMKDHSIRLYESILPQELGIADEQEAKTHTEHEIKKYRKWAHLLNFHSWAPASINANTYDILPGASIMSQNVLGTAVTSLGYEYSINDKQGVYFIDFEYLQWFPVVYSRLEYAYRKVHLDYHDFTFYYHETYLKAGSYLPLNFTSGRYFRSLQPRIQTSYIFLKIPEKYTKYTGYYSKELRTLDYQLFGYNLHKTGARDLYPKWGQVIQLNYRHDPIKGQKMGYIKSAMATFYFPGILKHHGIRIHPGIQENVVKEYRFSDYVDYPRGYHTESNENLWSVLTTYKFPVIYPDFSFGSLMYLKRISAAIFFDYAEGKNDGKFKKYQSLGLEIYTDAHYLRFLAPVTLGLRSSYIPDKKISGFGFIFSINFDDI